MLDFELLDAVEGKGKEIVKELRAAVKQEYGVRGPMAA